MLRKFSKKFLNGTFCVVNAPFRSVDTFLAFHSKRFSMFWLFNIIKYKYPLKTGVGKPFSVSKKGEAPPSRGSKKGGQTHPLRVELFKNGCL